MHAAVVRSFERAPRYEDFDLPPCNDENAVVLTCSRPHSIRAFALERLGLTMPTSESSR
ncbi:MAG: hypothetical protein ACLP1X_31930 [Polyangiaceae bacterium]|jgi:hypothetical protein